MWPIIQNRGQTTIPKKNYGKHYNNNNGLPSYSTYYKPVIALSILQVVIHVNFKPQEPYEIDLIISP